MNEIPISEIFGPTLQGEGFHAGVPTVFVRTGGCDYRCQWCLHGLTDITLASGVKKHMQDVIIGDMLMGYDESSKTFQITNVVDVAKRNELECVYVIKFKDNISYNDIICSSNHKFLTIKGWQEASALETEDIILTPHSSYAIIESCLRKPLNSEGILLYDIKCDPHPTFIANELVTHNCDTLYAVLPEFKHNWIKHTPEQIMEKVETLTNGTPILITFSGGNPALHNLKPVIELGRQKGYTFTMETQGSAPQSWFNDLDHLILSPKPPSSLMKTDWLKLNDCVNSVRDPNKVSLKVVVNDESDYKYAKEVFDKYPFIRKFITPCNISPGDPDLDAIYEKARFVVDMVLKDKRYDITILPQLHVLLWGNERGK